MGPPQVPGVTVGMPATARMSVSRADDGASVWKEGNPTANVHSPPIISSIAEIS